MMTYREVEAPHTKRLLWLAKLRSAGAAIEKTVSGALVSITDALAKPVVRLTADIDPVQDLNGQDAPYPAGGGKNKWNGEFVNSSYVPQSGFVQGSYAGNNAMPITVGSVYTASLNGVAEGMRYVFLDENKNAIGDLANANTTIQAPSNAVYLRWRIRSEATADGKYQIEVGSTASAWSPYSNICPITGWTECNVTRTGKNLCNTSAGVTTPVPTDLSPTARQFEYNKWYQGLRSDNYYYAPYVTYSFGENSVTVTPANNIAYGMAYSVKIEEGQGISVNATLTGTNEPSIGIGWYDKNGNWLSYNNVYTLPAIRTAPANACTAAIVFRSNAVNVSATYSDIQIEYSSTATTYEAYQGTTYNVEFPAGAGTVYGGTLENNGTDEWTLTVTMANIASYNGETINEPWLSSMDAYTSGTTPTTGAQVVYTLANPVTYTLTNEQAVTLLKGTNNVWADTGNIELVYKAKA